MPNQPVSAAAAPSTSPLAESWSEVRAHDHVMRYRRSGAGRAVLLLRAPGDDARDALWPELADALTAHFRVFVPDVSLAADDDVALWLNDFLDGLGVAGIAVVATDRFCIAALELALLDADRVARVVLVPGGRAEETGLDGALATTTRGATVPLLVVRRGLGAAEALPLVTRFLDGERGDRATG
jgi:hypothetical protein